jgi:hypothetical protein
MTKWEYTEARQGDRRDLLTELNRLGAEGWEVVSIHPVPDQWLDISSGDFAHGTAWLAFLKRPLGAAAPGHADA